MKFVNVVIACCVLFWAKNSQLGSKIAPFLSFAIQIGGKTEDLSVTLPVFLHLRLMPTIKRPGSYWQLVWSHLLQKGHNAPVQKLVDQSAGLTSSSYQLICRARLNLGPRPPVGLSPLSQKPIMSPYNLIPQPWIEDTAYTANTYPP